MATSNGMPGGGSGWLVSIKYRFLSFGKWCGNTWNVFASGLWVHFNIVCCLAVVFLTAWMFARGTSLIVADHQITKFQTIVLCAYSFGWVVISCFALYVMTRKDDE